MRELRQRLVEHRVQPDQAKRAWPDQPAPRPMPIPPTRRFSKRSQSARQPPDTGAPRHDQDHAVRVVRVDFSQSARTVAAVSPSKASRSASVISGMFSSASALAASWPSCVGAWRCSR